LESFVRSASVHVHLEPLTLQPLPDAGFAAAVGDGITPYRSLGETGVTQNGNVFAQPANVRPNHCDLNS